jgi:hypothetical protein
LTLQKEKILEVLKKLHKKTETMVYTPRCDTLDLTFDNESVKEKNEEIKSRLLKGLKAKLKKAE